ncbi:MAG: hypothetical protein KI791_06345 [Cyclobacteriaceae bacterium]|nr:hypothetical protein [Cyclobacteriaceae bacterium SS2]
MNTNTLSYSLGLTLILGAILIIVIFPDSGRLYLIAGFLTLIGFVMKIAGFVMRQGKVSQ